MRFSEVIGQQEIKEQLIRTVAENRVAHAQLFYGNEGHGKLALALAYAQFISCRDTNKFVSKDSCGTCPSCIKYAKLIHPDLHFIFPVAGSKLLDTKTKPSSRAFVKQWREVLLENDYYISLNDWYNKIDIEKKQASINTQDCSDILKTLSYTSYESEYKVMLIWMIEKLYYQAAPRLLKILEEPPEKTLFLLVAEQTDQVISTILSRLHMVKIPKIEDSALVGAVQQRLQVDGNRAEEIARLANGSFKEALRLHSQNEKRSEIFNKFVNWMRMCYQPDVLGIVKFSNEMGNESREQAKLFLHLGLEILRNCFVINSGLAKTVRMVDEEKDFYQKFSKFVHASNIEEFSKEFDDAIYHVERNVHGGMIFLDLSLTISKLLKIKAKQVAS